MAFKDAVYGYRFGNFTYVTDANRIDEDQQQKIRGSEAFVINALRHMKHISHYTLDEAIALVQQLNILQAYCTHISHQLGKHADISKELPAGIELAYDGLVLNFDAVK